MAVTEYRISGITLGPMSASGIQDAITTYLEGLNSGATIHSIDLVPSGTEQAQCVIIHDMYPPIGR